MKKSGKTVLKCRSYVNDASIDVKLESLAHEDKVRHITRVSRQTAQAWADMHGYTLVWRDRTEAVVMAGNKAIHPL